MKILVVSHCSVIAEYQADLKALANMGHEIVLITPEVYKEGGRPTMASTLSSRITHYKLKTLLGKQGKQHFHLYINALKICRIIKRFGPDVIYLYEEPNSLVTIQFLILKRILNLKAKTIVWTACNTERNYKQMFKFFDVRRWLFDFNIKLSSRLSDAAISISDDAAEVLFLKKWEKPIYISPTHFIDQNIFTLPINKTNPIIKIGIIGRLQYQKGFDLVIDALGGINKAFSLEVYGEGEDGDKLKALTIKNNIAHLCHWHGNISYRDMPGVFKKLDILIVPSREIGHLKEQFGRVVIEAMSSGVNVITSDSGYLPKIAGNLGLVFEQNNVEMLQYKIENLLDEKNRILPEILREHVIKSFSANATAERLSKIFINVTEQSINEAVVHRVYNENERTNHLVR